VNHDGSHSDDGRLRTGKVTPASHTGPADLMVHLALALSRYVRELRRDSLCVPAEIEELAAFLVRFVRSRLETTAVDEHIEAAHHPCVADRLLLTRQEAAERLGVSERTIDRLVASGRLPLVHVERAARLRVSDLEAYVQGLADGPAPPSDAEGRNDQR
jgi:excisionase family DNA binding protein